MTYLQSQVRQPIDVFVHVPKTAGTSLRGAAIEHYGLGSVFVLHGRTGLLSPARQAEDYASPAAHDRNFARKLAEKVLYGLSPSVHTRVLSARNKLERQPSQADMYRGADAILGHFTLGHYEEAFGELRPARFFTIVRDPLARMRSHYNYGRQLVERGQPLTGWTEGQKFGLLFEDFALSDEVLNFQSNYTGTDTSRYTTIGITERAADFMKRTGLIGYADEAPHYNKTQETYQGEKPLSSSFLEEFRTAHSTDYDFYAEAVRQQVVSLPNTQA